MPRPTQSRRLCILIADDSVDCADALGAICESAGHDVDFAYDAASALEAAQRLKPDVMFITTALPRAGAAGLVREIRADPDLCQVFVVALGAADGNIGFDEALPTPIDAERVLKLLKKRVQGL